MRFNPLLIRPVLTLGASAALCALFAGCATPPQGNPSNRLSTSTTTAGEARSAAIPTTALIEASDKVSQNLAADIQRIANEIGGQYRVTVVFGSLENKTQGYVNTGDFELLRDRIKSKLNQSGLFRENIKFVLNRAKLDELNRREAPGSAPDLLQEGTAASSGPAFNPAYTLYLNGIMYGSFREGTNLYYLKFEMIRASDGDTVFTSDYEIKRG
ncbi:MAG: hypothetical protein ACT4PL_11015 [Phycisphaerales bacterium]